MASIETRDPTTRHYLYGPRVRDHPCRELRLPRTTHTEREHVPDAQEFAELYSFVPAHH